MIVLHEPGIIFLKSRKTAGSSLEMALSAFAKAGDVITPLWLDGGEDKERLEFGYKGPMNYMKPFSELLTHPTWRDFRDLVKGKPLCRYHDHSTAQRAKWHLGARKWNRLAKVSIVRNPWDYMVSSYYWANRDHEEAPDFKSWCLSNHRLIDRNHRQYFIRNRCVIDHFIRFEHFIEDLQDLERKFPVLNGLGDIFSGMTAKKGVRPKSGPSLVELFSEAPEVDRLIRERCRFEIETFGYQSPKVEDI